MMQPGMVSPCEELLQYGGQGLRDDVMGLTGEGAVRSVGKGSGERLRRVKPESVRTNCREASRISSSVALGSRSNSVLTLRHMAVCATVCYVMTVHTPSS